MSLYFLLLQPIFLSLFLCENDPGHLQQIVARQVHYNWSRLHLRDFWKAIVHDFMEEQTIQNFTMDPLIPLVAFSPSCPKGGSYL